MSRQETVRGILAVCGSDGGMECRGLAIRFRKALLEANPDLTSEDLAPYDKAFHEEMPALAEAVRTAHVEAAAKILTEEQLATWRAVLALPELSDFFSSLRALGPEMANATRTVFATEGVMVHARCSETLFESLAKQQETAGS